MDVRTVNCSSVNPSSVSCNLRRRIVLWPVAIAGEPTIELIDDERSVGTGGTNRAFGSEGIGGVLGISIGIGCTASGLGDSIAGEATCAVMLCSAFPGNIPSDIKRMS